VNCFVWRVCGRMRRRVRVHARVFIRLWRSGQTLPPLADELGLQHADAAAVHLGEAARAPELRLQLVDLRLQLQLEPRIDLERAHLSDEEVERRLSLRRGCHLDARSTQLRALRRPEPARRHDLHLGR